MDTFSLTRVICVPIELEVSIGSQVELQVNPCVEKVFILVGVGEGSVCSHTYGDLRANWLEAAFLLPPYGSCISNSGW